MPTNMESYSLEDADVFSVAEVNGEDAREIFCKAWPTVEPVLEAAVALIKSPVAKGLLTLAISLLGALAKKICDPKA